MLAGCLLLLPRGGAKIPTLVYWATLLSTAKIMASAGSISGESVTAMRLVHPRVPGRSILRAGLPTLEPANVRGKPNSDPSRGDKSPNCGKGTAYATAVIAHTGGDKSLSNLVHWSLGLCTARGQQQPVTVLNRHTVLSMSGSCEPVSIRSEGRTAASWERASHIAIGTSAVDSAETVSIRHAECPSLLSRAGVQLNKDSVPPERRLAAMVRQRGGVSVVSMHIGDTITPRQC